MMRPSMHSDPLSSFAGSPADLECLLSKNRPLFPEFEQARHRLDTFQHAPHAELMLVEADALLAHATTIPQTTYTRYQAFARCGEREPYQVPYFRRRHTLNAAVLRFLMGRRDLRDTVHDYLWAICEESTWVVPAHARVIDLMAAETALWLAEALYLLHDELDEEVRRRVQREIDDRIFMPFLTSHFDLRWFEGSDNWNGVCSGAIGGAFLYVEQDPKRLADALALILRSLKTYLDTAFEDDGGTTEGVGYWRYGLNNVIIFAELLRSRTSGAIDLLAIPRLRQIASFPAKMLLPNDRFVSFSDCPAEVPLSPGLIARLAERTGEPSLANLLAPTAMLYHEGGGPRGLRNLLWWDGRRHKPVPVGDAVLPSTGIARLTGATAAGAPVVLIVKAGHNDENHNHNDIGSFVLNVAGEDFLTDPGPGRVDRDYFDARTRFANLFANSEGHGVPRIDGQLQGTGKNFIGVLQGIDADTANGHKSVIVECARAYLVATLEQAQRRLTLDAQHNALWLEDRFRFTEGNHTVDDVFVTRLPVTVAGEVAVIQGQHHCVRLVIEEPAGAVFALESLSDESRANDRVEVLRRLRIKLSGGTQIRVHLKMQVMTTNGFTCQ